MLPRIALLRHPAAVAAGLRSVSLQPKPRIVREFKRSEGPLALLKNDRVLALFTYFATLTGGAMCVASFAWSEEENIFTPLRGWFLGARDTVLGVPPRAEPPSAGPPTSQ